MSAAEMRAHQDRQPPRIVRRRSAIAGWGIFASDSINKNTRIVEYAGEKISRRESDRRERRQNARGLVWCFIIDRRWARDASVGGNIARYINHACRPNCYVEVRGDVIWIRAARRIAAGEELTYDYNLHEELGLACRCRPGCSSTM
jgi:SET domain-containing protein